MPLSRYEIRSEFGLANPDLYRAAEKDDPEGLLEGVAMAGLVGIIRQLGDLAEFAAEVFHDLHEDVLAVAARGHELLVRVRQLEREAPLIESLMLTKTSYGNFIYNQGIEWHPCIYNEQNHFSQGDLPGFIRSAYEDCRSPPRLYTLDRFDGTGAGACLKRYTDPSFFKMEWASSELMKAEREQRDQKARRLKKMGQQQENEMRDAVMESHVKFSVPDEVDKVETSSCHSQFSYSSNRSEQEFPDTLKDENGDMLTASSSIFSGQDGQLWNEIIVENSASAKVSLSPPNLQQEISDADSKKDSDQLDKALECSMKDADVAAGDSASDTENFMDAETMDSEVEADVETKESLEAVVFKSRPENEHRLSMPENDHSLNMPEIEIPGSQLFEDRLREITQEQVLDESVKHIIEENGRGDDSSRKDLMPGDLSKADWVFLNEDGVTAAPRQDESPRLSVTHTDANKDGSNIDIMLEDLSEADKGSFNEDATADSPRQDNLLVNRLYVANIGANDFSISNGTAAQSPSSAEDASAGNSKVLSTDLSLCESAKEGMNSLSDETSSNECDVLSPISQEKIQSGTKEEGVMPPLCLEEIPSEVNDVCVASTVSQELVVKVDESTVVSSEEPLQSLKSPPQLEETEDSGLSEPLEANVNSESLGGTTLAHFSQLQEPAASESQNQSSAGIEVVSTRKRWQINKLFDNVILAPDLAADNSQASESEHGESPLRPSLHSSPSASIQPMKWTIGLSNFYNSDDEIDGLQGSLGSLSSSSSALSSPRPSILATTLDGLNLGVKQMPISVSQRSATSSPSCSPLLGITDMVHERDIAVQMLTEGVMPTAEKPAHASIISSSAAAQQCFDSLPSLGLKTKPPASEILASPAADVSTLDTFPPPPPLPPLAWRMSRKSQGFVAGASDSPNAATQILQKNQVELGVSAPQGSDPLIAVSSNFSSTDGKQMLQDSVEGIQHETLLLDRKTLNNTEGSTTSDSTARAAAAQSLPVSTPTKWDVSSLADASLHGKFPCIISSHVLSGSLPQTVNTSARFDENRLEPETKRSGVDEVWQLSGRDSQAKSKSGNFSSEATTSHDSNMFKRRSKWALTESSDDREVLLEQIRNKSFSLRTSGTEKVAGSQPVVNINVAAILEKANAIRQAFAGSDDDEEQDLWSDA